MSNLNISDTRSKGITPELGRMKMAVAIFGVSRAWMYRAAQDHPGLLRKLGRSTLVDFAALRGILAALPIAKLRKAGEERSS